MKTFEEWLNEAAWDAVGQLRQMAAMAEKRNPGISDKVEELCALKHTAKQIAQKLGLTENDVRAIRMVRGIPSMSASVGMAGGSGVNPEFTAWLQQKHPDKVNMTLSAPPPPRKAQANPSLAPRIVPPPPPKRVAMSRW